MSSQNTVSYVIVDNDAVEEDLEEFSVSNEIDEGKLLEGLVQKHNAANEKSMKNWKNLAKEYLSLTGNNLSVGDLQSRWRNFKSKNKTLEDSIADVLMDGQNFEVKQYKDADGKMSTTIVLLNNDNDYKGDQNVNEK